MIFSIDWILKYHCKIGSITTNLLLFNLRVQKQEQTQFKHFSLKTLKFGLYFKFRDNGGTDNSRHYSDIISLSLIVNENGIIHLMIE